MNKKLLASGAVGALLSFAYALPAFALTVSCVGTPSAGAITWNSSTTGAVLPVALLWSNGSTSASQTISVSPGMYSMTLQATDASSSQATTTCAATDAIPAPVINSFTASPTSILNGQSSVLAWSVSNASTTSINNGVGTISSSSVTVSPSVTTTYTLTAVSPQGSVTSQATVTVTATTSTSTPPGVPAQIAALLAQIEALKKQIASLLGQVIGGGNGGNATSTPHGGNCFAFGRDLREGLRGDDVKALQKLLAKDPEIFASSTTTGYFGPATKNALKKFQKKFGIDATGHFGPKSKAFFVNQCSSMGDQDDDGIPNFFERGVRGKMLDMHGTTTLSGERNEKDKGKGKDKKGESNERED